MSGTRQELVNALPPLEELMRGSLISRMRRCGKPNCHCANGPGHGPYLYLSTVLRGRLLGGKRNKARKGELRFPLPVGFCYDSVGRTVLDPDEL